MTRDAGQITANEPVVELARYAENARTLLANGYTPLPIPPKSKRAQLKNWQGRTPESLSGLRLQTEIERYPDYGTALVCGELIALDLDWFDPAQVARAERIIRDIVLGEPLMREGQAPRRVLLYRAMSPIPTRHFDGFDVQGSKSYIMSFGIHPTGCLFRWIGPSPCEVLLIDLPVITPEQIEQIISLLVPISATKPDFTTFSVRADRNWATPVSDGRDRLMTATVYEVWCHGLDRLDELAVEAWRRFQERADLSRPKRNGTMPWTVADVRHKAKYLLARAAAGKVQRTSSLCSELTYQTEHEPFARAVDALGARGGLSPGAVRLSQLMLCLCRNGGGCFASVETLARQLDIAEGSVKRLRPRLVAAQLWTCRSRGQGRGAQSEYVPCVEAALAEAEKVTVMGTLITSWGGEAVPEEPQESETSISDSEDFISLGHWTAGGDA